ncbi:MAG: GtrA family protein, partial [Bacteroidales bacterium]|nr:GtrA family protein [Bacteroidales bacterium]
MKDIILKLFHKFRQLILYAIIGGISAGLDFVVFTLLCKAGMIVIAANIISIHCGIFCSFVLNRYFNFKVKDRALIRFLSFYVVGLIGLVFSTFLLWLMVENWLWNEIYAK